MLLLDLDGTLVDSLHDLAVSLNHTLHTFGLPERSLAEVRAFIGEGVTVLLGRALATEDAATLEEGRRRFFEHYREHCLDDTRVFAGWEPVLESDLPLAVLTNKPERFARRILEGLGLHKRLAMIVGGDTLPVRKPDLGVLDHMTEALGVARERCIMVGDGLPDGRIAQAAGIPFWAVRWGYGSEESLAPYATRWLADPREIIELTETR